ISPLRDHISAVEAGRGDRELLPAGGTLRHQNLWWAVGYNVIGFPLADGVFYPLIISPELAALATSGSSASGNQCHAEAHEAPWYSRDIVRRSRFSCGRHDGSMPCFLREAESPMF